MASGGSDTATHATSPTPCSSRPLRVASRERAEATRRQSFLGATRWDVEAVLGTGHIKERVEDIPGVPSKVVLAKARRLINRKVIKGCDCGCRGDFEEVANGG
jgi:hypothetical protein